MSLLIGSKQLKSRLTWTSILLSAFLAAGGWSMLANAQEGPTGPSTPELDSAAPAPSSPAQEPPTADPTKPVALPTAAPASPSSTRGGVAPFTRPLRFDPADNGLSIENPQTKWAFLSPTLINLNGLRLYSTSTSLSLTQVLRTGAPSSFQDKNRSPALTTLSFKWPAILSPVGTVTIQEANGRPLWRQKITSDELRDWRSQLKRYPSLRGGHEKSNWGLIDLPALNFLRNGRVIRFCLDQDGSTEGSHLRVCSGLYTVNAGKVSIKLTAQTDTNAKLGFLINNRDFGESGIINSKFGQLLRFKIQYQDSSSIEISALPADMKLLDAVATTNGEGILLSGHGEKPLGKVKILEKPITHFWAPTGISQERIWQVEIPRDVPVIRVLGEFNVPFNMLFAYQRLPNEEDRVYIEQTRSSGTYSNRPLIRGYSGENLKVSSQQASAANTEPNYFEWEFAAPNKGKENRSTLLVIPKNETNSWVAHYRLYRSYPYEMSGRLTSIVSIDGSMILLGEVSAAAYIESLGITQNAYISKQRWGLAGRYFKGLTAIQSDSGLRVEDLSAMNLDLKYNLLPGLWQYDELVGFIASIQKVSLAGLSHTAVGGGAYWARTMPKIFDDLFNYLPTLKHKKYVDMELVYYPMSLTSGYVAGSTFNLNFHGRVFWTDRFYGEAGFGIRRYEFTIPQRNIDVALSALYGTAGIGFVF